MAGTTSEHRFRVALHDTDAAGVLFFAHLFRHAHDAYEGLLEAAGWPLAGIVRERRLALPIVHAEADYRHPLRLGDAVGIRARAGEIGARRFAVDYRFARDDGRCAARARTVHVAVDPHAGSAIALPAALRAALAGTAPARPG